MHTYLSLFTQNMGILSKNSRKTNIKITTPTNRHKHSIFPVKSIGIKPVPTPNQKKAFLNTDFKNSVSQGNVRNKTNWEGYWFQNEDITSLLLHTFKIVLKNSTLSRTEKVFGSKMNIYFLQNSITVGTYWKLVVTGSNIDG